MIALKIASDHPRFVEFSFNGDNMEIWAGESGDEIGLLARVNREDLNELLKFINDHIDSHKDCFIDIKNDFDRCGLSSSLLNNLVESINPYALTRVEGMDENETSVMNIKEQICSVQNISDIKAMERLGYDMSDVRKGLGLNK